MLNQVATLASDIRRARAYKAESDRVLLSRGKGKVSRTFKPSKNHVSVSDVYAMLMTPKG